MAASNPLRFVLHVPAHPVSVGLARGAVRSLGGVVGEGVLRRGELVVSELVTNAIRHASPQNDDEIVLELSADDDGLAGAVSDHGPSFECPAGRPDPTSPGGLGLYIVDELTSSWSITRGMHGNDVRFLLRAC